MPAKYSKSVKLSALADHRSGETPKQISRKTGIPLRTVHNWIAGRGLRRIGKYKNTVNAAPARVREALLYAKCAGCYAEAARELHVDQKQIYEWSYRWE